MYHIPTDKINSSFRIRRILKVKIRIRRMWILTSLSHHYTQPTWINLSEGQGVMKTEQRWEATSMTTYYSLQQNLVESAEYSEEGSSGWRKFWVHIAVVLRLIHTFNTQPAIYPFLLILLFSLLLFRQRPLVVEKFVGFLAQVINTIHQQSKVLLQEWAEISRTDVAHTLASTLFFRSIIFRYFNVITPAFIINMWYSMWWKGEDSGTRIWEVMVKLLIIWMCNTVTLGKLLTHTCAH